MSRTDILGGTGTPNPVAYIVTFWKDERAAVRAKVRLQCSLGRIREAAIEVADDPCTCK